MQQVLRWGSGFVLALLACFSGCGPGVGGTGTGSASDELAAFGAESAPVCASPAAAQLACASTAAAPILSDGAPRSPWVDTATGGQIRANFQGNRVDLDARCELLHFTGEWGINAAGQQRFYGTYRIGAAALPQPAQLSLELPSGGAPNELLLVLQASDGSVLLGPVRVRLDVTLAAAPGVCQ